MSRNAPFRGNRRKRVPKSRGRSVIYRSISEYRLFRSKMRFGSRRFKKSTKSRIIKPSMMRNVGGRY